MTTYVLQYRPRRPGQMAEWKDAQEFEKLDKAVETRDGAVRYELKGTKDWRIVPRKKD